MNRALEFPGKLEFLPNKIYKNPPFYQVSFWLDPHAVPARVALGVTTLLTMSTQTASINSALPPVAYTKAIDVWQVSGNPHQILAVSHYICLLTDMCVCTMQYCVDTVDRLLQESKLVPNSIVDQMKQAFHSFI